MSTKKNSKYRIDLANKKVEKQILKLPEGYRDLIVKSMLKLESNPRPRGIKKLAKNIYRIRVGKYRIIFEINDNEKLVIITKVDKRDESTYKNF